MPKAAAKPITKTRSTKAKKDPLAPKGAKSAYIIFCEENREAVKGEAATNKDIMRILGERWKQLSDDDKTVFQEKSKKDKERAEKEKAAYANKKEKENRSEDTD